MSGIIRWFDVNIAHAQSVPSNVARLLLTITGPGIADPIRREIDPATGRATVDVPVGSDRKFEVQAFPSELPLANFIGSINADVPSTGTNVTVNMQAVTLNSIQVTPTNPQIAKGTIQRFTAMVDFSDGTVQDLTSLVDWVSSNTSVAVISNADQLEGLASGVQEGTTQITATLMNTTGETLLTVTAAEVAAITVTPAIPTIAVGTRLQFVAAGLFTDGTSQDLTLLASWSSSNPAVASISATGRASALAVGSSAISATFQDVTGDTLLTVTPVELAAITVTPAIPTIAVGTRLQFVATGLFTDGTSQDLTPSATWFSSPANVCSTSPSGLVTGLAVGTCTISATFRGVTGSATLSVTDAILAAIEVTPSIATIADGTTLQFVATGLFTDGTNQPLISGVTWMSSVPAVASISPTGLATAVAPGTTTISATFQGVTGSATLSVTGSPLVDIAITPSNPVIGPGATQQFTAIGIFGDETTQIITTFVTWESSNQYAATINSQGLATAESFGTTTISATFQDVEGSTILSVDGEGSIGGITKMSARFLSILGTAALTVMLMGLFFRGRAEEGPARRRNRSG